MQFTTTLYFHLYKTPHLLRIGLTGGIGSGKSTVAKIFQVLGVPVFDSDTEAKQLYLDNPELKAAIMNNFGEDIYANGRFNPGLLASRVFPFADKTRQLNELVHPLVQQKFEEWASHVSVPYIVKEAALLVESGSYKSLDALILVSAPSELRVKRTMLRDGSTNDQVLERMKRQLPDEDKRRYCQYEIINDDHTLLIPQVLDLHARWNDQTT